MTRENIDKIANSHVITKDDYYYTDLNKVVNSYKTPIVIEEFDFERDLHTFDSIFESFSALQDEELVPLVERNFLR